MGSRHFDEFVAELQGAPLFKINKDNASVERLQRTRSANAPKSLFSQKNMPGRWSLAS